MNRTLVACSLGMTLILLSTSAAVVALFSGYWTAVGVFLACAAVGVIVISSLTFKHSSEQSPDKDVSDYLDLEPEPDDERHTVSIDGQTVPSFQIDHIDERFAVHIDVVEAVEAGFDFTNVWRCKRVSVKLPDEAFDATVTRCEIEHGVAGLFVEPLTSEIENIEEVLDDADVDAEEIAAELEAADEYVSTHAGLDEEAS